MRVGVVCCIWTTDADDGPVYRFSSFDAFGVKAIAKRFSPPCYTLIIY